MSSLPCSPPPQRFSTPEEALAFVRPGQKWRIHEPGGTSRVIRITRISDRPSNGTYAATGFTPSGKRARASCNVLARGMPRAELLEDAAPLATFKPTHTPTRERKVRGIEVKAPRMTRAEAATLRAKVLDHVAQGYSLGVSAMILGQTEIFVQDIRDRARANRGAA